MKVGASDYDALVLGGGPAGSTLATLLAQDGLRVALVERERMPRPHVGESLIPGVLPALDASGALPLVEAAGFTQKYGATYIWGQSRDPWTVKFSEVYPDQAFAWQVDRAKFDKLLLDHAAAEGVEVRQGVTALGPLGSADQVEGARVRSDDGRDSALAADLTIDATGQDALFGRSFRTREYNTALRHVALYGHWSGGRDLHEVIGSDDAKDAGNILIVTVPDGWIWHIPIARSMRSVGLVTDPAAVANLSAASRTDYYLDQVRACPEIAALLEGGDWVSERVEALSDWSFFCSRFAGPGYLQVGDAACFVDPILSTGVTLAVNGALRAARAIRTGRAAPWLQGWRWTGTKRSTGAWPRTSPTWPSTGTAGTPTPTPGSGGPGNWPIRHATFRCVRPLSTCPPGLPGRKARTESCGPPAATARGNSS